VAQIIISDKHYQELIELAKQRSTTPDALVDLAMEEILDRLAQEARAACDRGGDAMPWL
jgi:hypothetical protein